MSYVPKSTILKMQLRKASSQKRKRSIQNFFKRLVALAFLIGTSFIILPQNLNKEIANLITSSAQRLDISLKEIVIEGNSKVASEQILKAASITKGENIYAISLRQIKEQVEKVPWIEYAIVERILPHTVKIIIEEEKARAVFIQNQNAYLINDMGGIIEKINDTTVTKNYTYLIGQGANLDYAQIIDDLYVSEEIHKNIEGLIKVNKRRWDVKLKNNITLKLPEANVREALVVFDQILAKNNILSKASVVDLRLLPDKIYIKY